MHLKRDKVDLKKTPCKNFFCIFFQSTHQVDMKNVVCCYEDFFGYFNALETHSDKTKFLKQTHKFRIVLIHKQIKSISILVVKNIYNLLDLALR